jgi:hypothetical protein
VCYVLWSSRRQGPCVYTCGDTKLLRGRSAADWFIKTGPTRVHGLLGFVVQRGTITLLMRFHLAGRPTFKHPLQSASRGAPSLSSKPSSWGKSVPLAYTFSSLRSSLPSVCSVVHQPQAEPNGGRDTVVLLCLSWPGNDLHGGERSGRYR